jgi:hypothetical protein
MSHSILRLILSRRLRQFDRENISQLPRKFRDHSGRPRLAASAMRPAQPLRTKKRNRAVRASAKAAPMISRQLRSLAILAALALAGCTVATLNLGATDYKGKPLSDVTTKLGQPNEVQTIAGQKAYIWNVGNTLSACQIRVVMAGDVVDTYEGSVLSLIDFKRFLAPSISPPKRQVHSSKFLHIGRTVVCSDCRCPKLSAGPNPQRACQGFTGSALLLPGGRGRRSVLSEVSAVRRPLW